ncbi:MAG: hypothetical protein ABF682_11595 [Liquorilactobacillus sp.]|uniref:hypothetical protein n=1 Tax=Liquorilactobacillus sp. TaxID=2767923 RepID=UPI0039E99244
MEELLVSIVMIVLGRVLVNRSLSKEQTTFEDLIGHKRRRKDIEPLIKTTRENKPAYVILTKLIVVLWSIIGILFLVLLFFVIKNNIQICLIIFCVMLVVQGIIQILGLFKYRWETTLLKIERTKPMIIAVVCGRLLIIFGGIVLIINLVSILSFS